MVRKNGFTLIEVLIAIAILSGMTIVLSQSFLSTTRGSMKSEIQTDVKQSGDFANRIMEQIIRQATSIPQANCTLFPTPAADRKTLQVNNGDGGFTTFQCDDTNPVGITRIASFSGVANPTKYYLTPTGVSLGGTRCSDNAMSLSFSCTSYPGKPSSIEITFTLSQVGSPQSQVQVAQTSFKTTVNVRN